MKAPLILLCALYVICQLFWISLIFCFQIFQLFIRLLFCVFFCLLLLLTFLFLFFIYGSYLAFASFFCFFFFFRLSSSSHFSFLSFTFCCESTLQWTKIDRFGVHNQSFSQCCIYKTKFTNDLKLYVSFFMEMQHCLPFNNKIHFVLQEVFIILCF